MAELWLQPWFWPAVAVVVGLPVVLLVLTELHSALERRGSRAAPIIALLRNYVAPVGALLLLLAQVRFAGGEVTWLQVTATVFGFLVILVLLNTLNFALFVTAREDSWRSRVPSIFVDIVRVLLILVSLAILFSVVWSADVGGLFAALGVGSIVLGLSLQNAVGSVVSGLLLLFEQPLKLGDWIEVGGTRGKVVEVNWRSTHLKTPSGIKVIPNSELAGSSFMNYSRGDSPFEAATVLRFATDDPPQRVIEVVQRVAADLPQAVPGEDAWVAPLTRAKYEVGIPVPHPGVAARTVLEFRTRIWYAARRAGLHLDRDLTDTASTPEAVAEALQQFAPALYLAAEQLPGLVPRVRLERYCAGETVHAPREAPEGMRYIISGTAAISTSAEVGAVVVFESLGRGDVLGLTAITRQGMAARTSATSELEVLLVPTELLDELVATSPQFARDIGSAIDLRRARANEALRAVGVSLPDSARVIA